MVNIQDAIHKIAGKRTSNYPENLVGQKQKSNEVAERIVKKYV